MSTPRAWTSVSGQTTAGKEIVVQGEESLRTVRFDPKLARITVDTSVTPPRIVLTSSVDLTPIEASVAALGARLTTAEGEIDALQTAPPTHGSSHLTAGSDPIPLAGGAADGLMSTAHFGLLNQATNAASGGALVRRDGSGNARFAEPVDGSDAATKDYVDNAIGASLAELDMTDLAAYRTVARQATNSAYGNTFLARGNCSATAIKFYHKASGTETIRVRLWDLIASTSIATATTSVSADGVYTVTFASSVALSKGKLYAAVCYNETNNVDVRMTAVATFDNLASNSRHTASALLDRTTSAHTNGGGDIQPTALTAVFPVQLVAV